MRVLIAGAHGQIGQRLIKQMSQGPHQSRAMIRDPDQAETLRDLGADETVVADLEGDCRDAVKGCDAVIFAAGSGGHTGPEKTEAVDRDGAIGLVDATREAGVQRFVMISSMGADSPESGEENMQPYLRAKQAADNHLRKSGLLYTIVRPGSLTDAPGNERVDAAEDLGRFGEVPRDDVAAVLLAVLDAPNTHGKHFELLAGETPISEAVANL